MIWLEFWYSVLVDCDLLPNNMSGEILRVEYPGPALIDFVLRDAVSKGKGIQHITIRSNEVYLRKEYYKYSCMEIMAESPRYAILKYCEDVTLVFKQENHAPLCIGHFYGDVTDALIDRNEKFVVMGGCGVIVYFLEVPFKDYQYDIKTNQWIEYRRGSENTLWVEHIRQVDDTTVELTDADGTISRLLFDLNPCKPVDVCAFHCTSGSCPGGRMVHFICGHSLTVFCSLSNDVVATSYFPPVYTDEKSYTLTITNGNIPTPESIKILSAVTQQNYLQVRKLLTAAPLPALTGKATIILPAMKKLSAAGIRYTISPDFPYTEDDFWQEQ